jgi:hypothetical protein
MPQAAAAGASGLFAPRATGTSMPAAALQSLVDRAANLNLFSMPARSFPGVAIFDSRFGAPIGLRNQGTLHRFQIGTQAPTVCSPLVATQTIGEEVGQWTQRWMFAPDDFVATPGHEPPPTPLDVSRPQRFVMLDSICKFGGGENGFRGFGTGQTQGTDGARGSQLLVTATGTILEGFGQLEGHEEGTYLYCGTIDPRRGFTGNVILRVMDPHQTFSTDSALCDCEAVGNPHPDITYLLFRGEAVPSDAVTPRMSPTGQPLGLIVEQGLRLFDVDLRVKEEGRLVSTASVGPPIGKITSIINFNPASPGGTALNPIPFTNFDEFVFTDPQGRRVGGFTGTSSEGRVFLTQVAGQPAIRFGGTGRILSGEGVFEGISGLLTDNSVVVFSPHVSASIYLLRIPDPARRFRWAWGCH